MRFSGVRTGIRVDGKRWKRQYVHMKTTVDLPEVLYRKAKIEAVERGSSLRDLMVGALQRELAVPCVAEPQVPYFARRQPLPAFEALAKSGALRPASSDRDVTDVVSEDRDRGTP